MIKSGVSVIICCHNSARRLPETLKYIAYQKVPESISWEVILVDNASTDNTTESASKLWKENGRPTSLRILEEKQVGLSFARHAGFTNAKYEYCLFCDDDNWLDRNYVTTAYKIMQKDGQIGVLGGVGEAVCETEKPEWFEDYKQCYAVGPQSTVEGDITKLKGHVYGAGAVFRKSVYDSLVCAGFKNILKDRTGKSLSSGGDVELCYVYALNGWKIFYSHKLKFQHFIPSGRLNKRYPRRIIREYKKCEVVLMLYKYKMNNEHILKKKYLWLREVVYIFRQEYKYLIKPRYLLVSRFYALLINRSLFVSALKELR
ncbi:glycosyltransferase [Catalinimonas niigatensis]|uniref:glycosyltransferase n=1 Tax=Catalinimonas niigatensis TaxID=1397264 RepID=UPI002665AFC4|nr:glycosyltransferase [Catalinimonas niigatensis]WPP52620.1 glycosyltransferase [Catalinimonas niigatensis]